MCACKTIGLLNTEGMKACNEGRMDEAVTLLRRAVDQARAMGAATYEAKLRNNLGLVFCLSGQPREAESHLRLALAQVERRVGRGNRLYAHIERNLAAVAAPESRS